ncbi:hypothetical protein [Methylobacterium aquaticum]|nr:hypothetical protein [Methylobacterium aquaticum]
MERYNIYMSRHLFNMTAAESVEYALWKAAAWAGGAVVVVSIAVALAA